MCSLDKGLGFFMFYNILCDFEISVEFRFIGYGLWKFKFFFINGFMFSWIFLF